MPDAVVFLRLHPDDPALRLLAMIDRKVDRLMADLSKLSVDEGVLADALTELVTDLTQGLTDLHVQIAGLQNNPGDQAAVDALDSNVTALIARVQSADSQVRDADPGPAELPAPDAPVADEPVHEAPAPEPEPVPEVPAEPVVDQPAPADPVADVPAPADPVAEPAPDVAPDVPAAPADPAV